MKAVIFIKKGKRLKLIISLSVVAVSLGILMCQGFLIPHSMQQQFGIEPNKVDCVDLFDGTCGTHHKMSDQKEIQNFLHMFDGITVWKSLDQQQYTGVIFCASLYSKGKLMSSFTFGYNRMLHGDPEVRYISSKTFEPDEMVSIRKTYQLER